MPTSKHFLAILVIFTFLISCRSNAPEPIVPPPRIKTEPSIQRDQEAQRLREKVRTSNDFSSSGVLILCVHGKQCNAIDRSKLYCYESIIEMFTLTQNHESGGNTCFTT